MEPILLSEDGWTLISSTIKASAAPETTPLPLSLSPRPCLCHHNRRLQTVVDEAFDYDDDATDGNPLPPAASDKAAEAVACAWPPAMNCAIGVMLALFFLGTLRIGLPQYTPTQLLLSLVTRGLELWHSFASFADQGHFLTLASMLFAIAPKIPARETLLLSFSQATDSGTRDAPAVVLAGDMPL